MYEYVNLSSNFYVISSVVLGVFSVSNFFCELTN